MLLITKAAESTAIYLVMIHRKLLQTATVALSLFFGSANTKTQHKKSDPQKLITDFSPLCLLFPPCLKVNEPNGFSSSSCNKYILSNPLFCKMELLYLNYS